jgi:transposase-like protein
MKNVVIEKSHHYSEAFKLQVLRDYYESGHSLNSTAKKWQLSCYSLIVSWMKHYPIDSKSLSLSRQKIDEIMKKRAPKTLEEEQSQRIKELEKALEYEKLRSLAYSTMIDIAEKEFNIPIRKKPGTKQ